MTEIIKKDTDYAMRMLAFLALNDGKSPVAAKKLAKDGEVPEDFAYKILRKLTRAGLAVGTMGSHGGFKLGKAPKDIALLEVVSAVQGDISVRKCCLAKDACPRQGICDISKVLGGLQNNLTGSLKRITLADILKEAQYKK
ncbi:MAG: Rrf2 family transcriptional regulator [Dehalococcoidales bacterium]|nr:Rrf2 family transcriptional regulator [Dehalococcoidales bacterium]